MPEYELAIADRTYSSWSLRGWLLFEKFGIPVREHRARMYLPEFKEMLANFAPARLVPAMKFDGHIVSDTFAMAETLHEQNPDKGLWPEDPAARALARSLVAEMHSSFMAIREDCTMNLRHAYPGFEPSAAVLADVARATELWEFAWERYGTDSPWLFGKYSVADVFYAPFVTRLATYHLPCTDRAKAYMNAHLEDTAFRRWRAMGLAQNFVQPGYDLDLPPAPWPGPTPLKATALESGTPENSQCPYSGDASTHFMELDGRTFGFCNSFCRDKTVNDAAAWPAFMAIYQA